MKNNLIHSRTCVYNINYHVVWTVKYRRKVLSSEVSKTYACKANRVHRGLYRDGDSVWNADVVGAFNILRLYAQDSRKKHFALPPVPSQIVKVAV